MSAVLNALLIGPSGNRDRGVQIGDEPGLLHCTGEVICQGGIKIKVVRLVRRRGLLSKCPVFV
jgi:hypothetical protein